MVQFYFPLFWDMLMYDNELKTKINKIEAKDKIEPQHMYTLQHCYYDNYDNSYVFSLRLSIHTNCALQCTTLI